MIEEFKRMKSSFYYDDDSIVQLRIYYIQYIYNGENIFVIIFCTNNSTFKSEHFIFRRFFNIFFYKKTVENLGQLSKS